MRRVSSRLPLPASVFAYNVFCSSLPTDNLDSSPWYYHRPEPAANLLHSIRLELVVSQDESNRNEDLKDGAAPRKTERVLYSHVTSMRTIQPVWHHLNESIDLNDFCVEEYESMTLRFSLVDETEEDPASPGGKPLPEKVVTGDVVWQQLLIHPSKLTRIGRLPEPEKEKLPLNLIAVQYTDGSLRISPMHYQSLSELGNVDLVQVSNTINKVALNRIQHLNESQTEDNFGRFEDTVFRTLDQVTPVDPVKDNPERHVSANGNDETPGTVSGESSGYSSARCRRSILDEETRKRALRDEILEHERALQEEIAALNERNEVLQSLEGQIETRKRQTLKIARTANDERKIVEQFEFGLQGQKIRLVRDLQSLFPITVTTSGDRHRFCIRGIELPPATSEMLFSIAEEDLAAALGYLCHLVHMLSKYLAIQLRYRLLCHSSRSGIQDDKAILYPLFLQNRTSAERDQLEHGIRLLHHNVESILQQQGVGISKDLHLLGKVKRCYEHVSDGY